MGTLDRVRWFLGAFRVGALLGCFCLLQSWAAEAEYGVQVGAFAQRANAERLERRLQAAGFVVERREITLSDGRALSEIVVGPYGERAQAEAAQTRLRALGWAGYVRQIPGTEPAPGPEIDPYGMEQASPSDAPPGGPADTIEVLVFEPDPAGQTSGDPQLSPSSAPEGMPADTEVLVFEPDPAGQTPGAPQALPSTTTEGMPADAEVLIFEPEPGGEIPAAAPEGGEILVFPEPGAPAAADGEVLILEGEPLPEEGMAKPAEGIVPKEGGAANFTARLRLEGGGLLRSGQAVNTSSYAHGSVAGRWELAPAWEVQLAARVDGHHQAGSPDFDSLRLDYGESFVRYRGEGVRATLGPQVILWGRIDEVPPTDRLSVQDLTRFVLDELPDRRRAVPALRVEGFRGDYKLDVVWIPEFRAAELPHPDSIWSPVDRINGRLLGVEDNALLGQFVSAGSYDEDEHGWGGAGIRLSRSGAALDYALTVQRFKHSAPYYELHPTVRATYLGTLDVATALASTSASTFTARHPSSWLFGADLGFASDRATWRMEAAYLSDVPVTTADLRMVTLAGLDWMMGVEFYPGDGDVRANLQIGGRHLLDAPSILDRANIYTFNGSFESLLAHGRWRAKLRFSSGLDEKDIYLNPELAYLGLEPHELYVAVHYFDGAGGTFGGFHQDNGLLSIGWRAKY